MSWRTKLRNIGIVAHINAGKTTTTERILYQAGTTNIVGDVDRGNTVTDYLVQERDRGITITSAAVSLNWQKHRINLIDTPGHVDFTFEVERSLSVLDGAVTMLDSSAGVEAQTVTVWNQASRYKIPSIIYLNKYDKPQADEQMCLKDLRDTLEMRTNLIQLPMKNKIAGQVNFNSLIDIIERKLIRWVEPDENLGSLYSQDSLDELDGALRDQVEEERERLVNTLTDCDETLANHVISDCNKLQDVSKDLIHESIRRQTIECNFSPVLIGSSFKYVGVQPLLDAVVRYLPNPIERGEQIRRIMDIETACKEDSETCAFIFKIMHDKRLGALNYIRIYGGSLSRNSKLKNLDTDKPEQVKKLFRVFADELKEMTDPEGALKDDIVVATGPLETRTGDILVNPGFSRRDSQQESSLLNKLTGPPFDKLNDSLILPRIDQMEPVFFCSIEARKISHQIKLEQALAIMAREDPSFTFNIDSMGVITIKGMGKLHLEILRDRLLSEHGVESVLGPLQISYRESIVNSANETLDISRLINGANNSVHISIYIRPKANAGPWSSKMLRLDMSGENSLGRLRNDHKKAIENGFSSTMSHGPLLGYPVVDCDIQLVDFQANGRCGLPVISSAASQCLTGALARSSPRLLEPIMLVEVVTPREHNGALVQNLASGRRAVILSTQARANGTIIIRSRVPLGEMSDYSEYLRITTSGRASFSMELHSYTAMSEKDRQNVARL